MEEASDMSTTTTTEQNDDFWSSFQSQWHQIDDDTHDSLLPDADRSEIEDLSIRYPMGRWRLSNDHGPAAALEGIMLPYPGSPPSPVCNLASVPEGRHDTSNTRFDDWLSSESPTNFLSEEGRLLAGAPLDQLAPMVPLVSIPGSPPTFPPFHPELTDSMEVDADADEGGTIGDDSAASAAMQLPPASDNETMALQGPSVPSQAAVLLKTTETSDAITEAEDDNGSSSRETSLTLVNDEGPAVRSAPAPTQSPGVSGAQASMESDPAVFTSSESNASPSIADPTFSDAGAAELASPPEAARNTRRSSRARKGNGGRNKKTSTAAGTSRSAAQTPTAPNHGFIGKERVHEHATLYALPKEVLLAYRPYKNGNERPEESTPRTDEARLYKLTLLDEWEQEKKLCAAQPDPVAALEALRDELDEDARELRARFDAPEKGKPDIRLDVDRIQAVVLGRLDTELAKRKREQLPTLSADATELNGEERTKILRRIREGAKIPCAWCGKLVCARRDTYFEERHLGQCTVFHALNDHFLIPEWRELHRQDVYPESQEQLDYRCTQGQTAPPAADPQADEATSNSTATQQNAGGRVPTKRRKTRGQPPY
ncbi:hypothetical protein AURDEDRAFT_173729 [Auricularia subglabra TFB-10046 SS5]|uniref:Uncharacterized protein n=1 Tax=Auricularia subglabra (strain TFB-10046 / SS5) TaxID=717982 RepID=J0DAG5_AURST|nr:hypothetical protein AURDEDRAFT_173729 [Auricularia subglabra TFB-10046 SS5]